MTLIINTVSPAGIVLAGDSRQTYRNTKNVLRIGSDTAEKIFMVNRRTGLAVSGPAFLPTENGPRDVSKFISEFVSDIDGDLTIFEVAEKVRNYFRKKYDYQRILKEQKDRVREDLTKQGIEIKEIVEEESIVKIRFNDPKGQSQEITIGVEALSFIVSGYNLDGSHQTFICYIPGEIQEKRDSKKQGMEYGATWIGQNDVVVRVVKGFDPKIELLPFVQDAIKQKGLQVIEQQVGGLEYAINWGAMTLQDAIDFSILIINTTAAIQKFSDGIKMDPGGIPGVGGPVDVAIISPDKGFIWVSKKDLKANEDAVNLSEHEDLKKTKPLGIKALNQSHKRGKKKVR